MMVLSHRALLALAAVADIAIHARPLPVAAKALAARLELPPRHLETLLQALVRARILKGLRGPRGGYELARERRKITAGAILRAVLNEPAADGGAPGDSKLVTQVVAPLVEVRRRGVPARARHHHDRGYCERAEALNLSDDAASGSEFLQSKEFFFLAL